MESGTSYARFRLTTDPITTSNSTGFASDGEVEDYQLDLVASTEYKMSGTVYSDTNNPSEDSIEDSDTPIGGVTLKLYTDSDGDGVKDTDGSGNLLPPIATTTTDADTGLYEFTGLANGSYVVVQDQPADYDSVTDVDSTTPDNQIAVTINNGDQIEKDFLEEIRFDYGDAPDDGNTGNSTGDYSTLDSNNGPSHGIVNGLTLGSTVDAESDASPNTTATGDDTTGSDDEDGIEFIDTKIISNNDANDSYSVQAIVNATGDATLVGWIDFDRNGTFDSTEGVTLSSDPTNSTDGTTTLNTDGTTANILTWTGINSQTNGVTPGDTYARFRLSSDDLTTNDATGAASDGEVEDYALKIKNEVSGTGAGEVINDTYTSDPTTVNDDLIIGGAGQDTLSGGDGDDCFHFNRTSDGIDIITDFKENGDADKLDFSDMFATGGELEGIENPFGTYVIATSDASGTLVQVDFVPGDDLNNKNVVYLQGYTDTLTADDFVF